MPASAQIDSPPLPELQAGRSDANAGSDPEAAGAWRAASDVADAEVIGGYTVSPGTASAPTPDGGQVGEKVPPDVVEGTVVDPDPESTQPPVREEERRRLPRNSSRQSSQKSRCSPCALLDAPG